MDQVRAIARIIWLQRFWVLSVVATSAAVVCWYLAAGDLQSQFTERLSSISGQFSAVGGLTSGAYHPNEDVIQGDRAQAVEQRNNVLQVWSDLYERQHTEVLNWNQHKELGDDFVEYMNARNFRDPIKNDYRDRYRNYIKKRFDALLEIVQARKTEGSDGRFGARRGAFRRGGKDGPGPGPRSRTDEVEPDDDYLVEWHDQGALEAQLFFLNMPSPDQIWVTQEDLWVYETLLHVIARTNKQRGATRPDNTAVREIERLQVGMPAIGTSMPLGQIYMPQSVGGREGEESGPTSYNRTDAGGGFSGGFGGGSGEGDGSALFANRYLNPEGQPISGDELSAEFRQLPIHMKLRMDQRWIPQILIECANAPLPVEVKWIRVNPEKARSAVGGRIPVSRPGSRGPVDDSTIATVEIQGVVLIYGKPDEEMLSVPGAEEEEGNELASAPSETF